MEVIPAIDLREGKCVRLFRGDFSKEEIYSQNPDLIAKSWVEFGAKRIHVVDLDGAADGNQKNFNIIAKIAAIKNVSIQVGGGIRDLITAQNLFAVGVSRLVLGTSAIENPGFIAKLLQLFSPQTIAIALDVRGIRIATRGWKQQSNISVKKLIDQMRELGIKRFIYTDINRDGTLTHPNYATLGKLVSYTSAHVIASGGISSLKQLSLLAETGVEGAIIGKALYTGKINLREAIAAGL